MTEEEKSNIKFRLSDIGKQVGELALEYIAELEKENAELKERNEKLKNMASKQVDEMLKLYGQIEKMKCCGNCKHSQMKNCGSMPRIDFDRMRVIACDKWELAE